MMLLRSMQTLVTLCLLALIAACASKPVEPVLDFDRQYDFSKARKIAIQPVSRENPCLYSHQRFTGRADKR